MQEAGHGIKVLPYIDDSAHQMLQTDISTHHLAFSMFFWEPLPWPVFCSTHCLNITASFPTCSGDDMAQMQEGQKDRKREQVGKGRRINKCLNKCSLLSWLCFSILPIGYTVCCHNTCPGTKGPANWCLHKGELKIYSGDDQGRKMTFCFFSPSSRGSGTKGSKDREVPRTKWSHASHISLDLHKVCIKCQPFPVTFYSRYYFNPATSPLAGKSWCFPGCWWCREEVMECF